MPKDWKADSDANDDVPDPAFDGVRTCLGEWMQQAGISSKASTGQAPDVLSGPQFESLAAHCLAGVEDKELFHRMGQVCGVWPASPNKLRQFSNLYQFVREANGGSADFTVPFLAAIGEEVGFGSSLEERAREALTESSAI